MSIYKEILREALIKGPGLNIYIIFSQISKKEIKIFPKGSFPPVLIFPLELSSYLKKRYFLEPGSAN
jgi:hypothetical protein